LSEREKGIQKKGENQRQDVGELGAGAHRSNLKSPRLRKNIRRPNCPMAEKQNTDYRLSRVTGEGGHRGAWGSINNFSLKNKRVTAANRKGGPRVDGPANPRGHLHTELPSRSGATKTSFRCEGGPENGLLGRI